MRLAWKINYLPVPNAKSRKGLLGFLHQLRDIRHSGISFGRKYDPISLLNPVRLVSFKRPPEADQSFLPLAESSFRGGASKPQFQPSRQQVKIQGRAKGDRSVVWQSSGSKCQESNWRGRLVCRHRPHHQTPRHYTGARALATQQRLGQDQEMTTF